MQTLNAQSVVDEPASLSYSTLLEMQTLRPQLTFWIRNCILIIYTGDWEAHYNFKYVYADGSPPPRFFFLFLSFECKFPWKLGYRTLRELPVCTTFQRVDAHHTGCQMFAGAKKFTAFISMILNLFPLLHEKLSIKHFLDREMLFLERKKNIFTPERWIKQCLLSFLL